MTQFTERKVRADLDLEDLENFCGTVQNMSVCKLIRISKKADEAKNKKFNLALFEEVDIQDDVPKPILKSVGPGDNLTQIISEQLGQGQKFIFDAVIFVENKDTRVLGFR